MGTKRKNVMPGELHAYWRAVSNRNYRPTPGASVGHEIRAYATKKQLMVDTGDFTDEASLLDNLLIRIREILSEEDFKKMNKTKDGIGRTT